MELKGRFDQSVKEAVDKFQGANLYLKNLDDSIGEGMSELSLANRATIANMSPEYGATMGFFPVDHVTLQYLKLTGRSDDTVSYLFSVPSVLIKMKTSHSKRLMQ
ncbi:hypothetical protein AAC387_Pa06g1305 [Persea americana]